MKLLCIIQNIEIEKNFEKMLHDIFIDWKKNSSNLLLKLKQSKEFINQIR